MVALGEVVRGWTHGTPYKGKPNHGVVVHNTQGFTPLTTYESGGGWQRLIGRTGTVYRDVPDTVAAWHVEATGHTPKAIANTRWRPDWMRAAPDFGVSDANYSALGVELEGFDQKYTEWQYGALKRVLWDWTKGILPVVSHQQLQKDRTDPVRFDYPAVFKVPYAEATNFFAPLCDPLRNGALWPLHGTDWSDPLKGGYNFLDMTDSGKTAHPGVDLNAGAGCHADAGNLVVSPCEGTVMAVGYDDTTTRSVGWNVWIEATTGEWHHLCHLQDVPNAPQVGRPIALGQTVGRCGRTKGWDCEHLHWEIRRTPPPGNAWHFWPYNWSQEQVAKDYIDPLTWIVVRGKNGLEEPAKMAVLNDRELYNVINNGWQQFRSPGVPCDPNSAHYKLIVDRLHAEKVCPLPYGPEQDHGLTEAGKRYSSQWWEDGTMSVWVDGMEKAELGG